MRRTVGWTWAIAIGLALGACKNAGQSDHREDPGSAPSASSSALAAGSASSGAPTEPARGAATQWAGTYKSEAGKMYIPHDAPNAKDWASVKWTGDDASVGLGEGNLSLTIDPRGRVSGTLDGPLGPATLNGVVIDKQLTAKIERVDPLDGGFTGTAVGTVKDDAIEGTMHLSLAQANVLRTSPFSLKKK